MTQWNPYQISVLDDSGWRHFDLERTPELSPDFEPFMTTKVFVDGEEVLCHIGDMPKDEHDTAEIIDILNSEFQLGLY